MSLNADGILFDVESHAASIGYFERVNKHEPKNAPGNGLTAAIWVQNIGPVPTSSGLRVTSARLELKIRIFSSMLQEPRDSIDPNVLSATSKLIEVYSGDFELGGNVRNVDLLGQAGEALNAKAGYVNIDNTLYRVMDITLPLIVNDVWDQAG